MSGQNLTIAVCTCLQTPYHSSNDLHVNRYLPHAHLGYAEPVVYNARIVGNVFKQVYIAESMAPPKNINTVIESYKTMWSRLSDRTYFPKMLQSGQWKKFAIYGVEAYGIFTIGEMVSCCRMRVQRSFCHRITGSGH